MNATRLTLVWAALLTAALFASWPDPALARESLADGCHEPEWLTDDVADLRQVAQRYRKSGQIKVVALGSSSTLGSGGSGTAAAWPARLQDELARRLPKAQVSVVNKGKMRQSAQEMVGRMASDVESERPDLVIWEAGTAEAVRGIEVDQLTHRLFEGVDRLTQRGIDVILMDMQYARSTARVINFDRYVEAMSQVGTIRNIYVFQRFAVMRGWVEDQSVSFDDQTPAEAMRGADRIYGCIATFLAEVIVRSMAR